jgi:hypothetical protein
MWHASLAREQMPQGPPPAEAVYHHRRRRKFVQDLLEPIGRTAVALLRSNVNRVQVRSLERTYCRERRALPTSSRLRAIGQLLPQTVECATDAVAKRNYGKVAKRGWLVDRSH